VGGGLEWVKGETHGLLVGFIERGGREGAMAMAAIGCFKAIKGGGT
jgi:hypothetical protein